MQNYSLKIDLRIITGLLLAVIVGMLLLWRPWQSTSQKTIKVSGEGTVSAAPDEYVFNPVYQKQAATLEQAVALASEQGNAVVAKLKSLGLDSSMIKTNVSSNPDYSQDLKYSPEPTPGKSTGFVASYNITATVKDQDIAKKVLEYIATTPALNGVTPQSSFQKTTRTKLETEARAKAIKDAKAKAEQTASELGIRLGKVVSVSELNQYGPYPYAIEGRAETMVAPDRQQPQTPSFEIGTQDLTFSLTVEYQIK